MASETFTGSGEYTWTVPESVTSITVFCRGGAGGAAVVDRDGIFGSGERDFGGDAGYIEGEMSVSPGDTLTVRVGGNGGDGSISGSGGSGGYNGGGSGVYDDVSGGAPTASGGGGGASDLRDTDGTVMIAAGGGAGGGAVQSAEVALGDSGSAGQDGADASVGAADGIGGTVGDGSGMDGANGASESESNGVAVTGGAGGGWAGGGAGSTSVGNFAGSKAAAGGSAGGTNDLDSSLTLIESGVTTNTTPEVTITYVAPPDAPTNVTQSVSGDDTIDVTWDENTSGGPADSYDVQVSEDGGQFTQVANVMTESLTYSASASTNSHRFRVRAVNETDSSAWTQSDTVYTEPRDLTASQGATGSIDLSWTGVRDTNEYELWYATSSQSPGTAGYTSAGTTTGTTGTISGLTDGKQYFARVTAVYSGANSQVSNEASAVTALPATDISTLEEQ